MPFLMIYSTYPNEATAEKIVKQLVEEKLVACGNSFPIKSAYWWQEAIENDDEWVSIVKTVPKNWTSVEQRITQLHPYEIPCIIKIEAQANAAYEAWIESSVV